MGDLGTERPKFCDDWDCPASVSCARHFGRSKEYASMGMAIGYVIIGPSVGHGAGTHFWRGLRDHCPKYEFDKPKVWLMPQPGQCTHSEHRA